MPQLFIGVLNLTCTQLSIEHEEDMMVLNGLIGGFKDFVLRHLNGILSSSTYFIEWVEPPTTSCRYKFRFIYMCVFFPKANCSF